MKLAALPVPLGLVPAVVTVPPLKAMAGAVVKPVPAFVIVMPLTTPPVSTAVAVAPVPPPPLMATVGAAEYTVVPPLIVKLAALTPSVAVAAAPVPLPVMVTVGRVAWVPPVVTDSETTPLARVAAVALSFASVPPPSVMLSTTPDCPFKSSVPPVATLVTPMLSPSARGCPVFKVPALTVVVPEWVFAPEMVQVPASFLAMLGMKVALPLLMIPVAKPVPAPESWRTRPVVFGAMSPSSVSVPALTTILVSPPPLESVKLPRRMLSPASLMIAPLALLVVKRIVSGRSMGPPLPSRRSWGEPFVPLLRVIVLVPLPSALRLVMRKAPELTFTPPVKELLPVKTMVPALIGQSM